MSASKQAERVVARHGVTAWLVTLATAIMSFLMIYILQLGQIAGQVSAEWETSLTKAATVRVIAQEEELTAAAGALDEVLKTTPGIISFEEISPDAQIELLSPWLGDELPRNVINLPRLFAVEIDRGSFDEDALILRLQAEAPASVWDNHNRWRGPLLDSAKQLRTISWVSALLITLTFAGLIFISAEATIASNAQSISLLRQIGGDDRWIKGGFVRKFALRALLGAAIGAIIGYFAVKRLLAFTAVSTNISSGDVASTNVMIVIAVIVGAVFFTVIATLWATNRYLNRTL